MSFQRYRNFQSVLRLFSIETGKFIREIPLGMDAVVDITEGKTKSEVFVQVESFVSPGIIYRYDFSDPNAKPTVIYEMKPNLRGFDQKNFEVEQVFYHSLDGTRIPMFLMQKISTKNKIGPKPTLLYGYGGFASPQLPTFNLEWFFFVNSFDGIFALPNIRGGGEYGEKWHRDGMSLKKQNSFNDFQAAAEYLITNQYTTRNQLSISGISNGGLLIGACINQRPDLYGAAIVQAGDLDLIRYHLFTSGSDALPEYGDPNNPIQFKNILKISPMHNVHTPNSTQFQYPATLITTADHDDRIPPLISYKFTATLQHAVQGNKYQTNPIIMKLLKDAGHHDGKPTYKLIDQETDILTFLYRALAIDIEL